MAHRKPSFILPALHFCSQNGVGFRRRVLHILSLGALRRYLHWVINVAQKGPETQPSVPGLHCSTARQHGSWLLYTWPGARENQLCQQMLLPMNWWNHKKMSFKCLQIPGKQGSICVAGGVLGTSHTGVEFHPPGNHVGCFHRHVKKKVTISECNSEKL